MRLAEKYAILLAIKRKMGIIGKYKDLNRKERGKQYGIF